MKRNNEIIDSVFAKKGINGLISLAENTVGEPNQTCTVQVVRFFALNGKIRVIVDTERNLWQVPKTGVVDENDVRQAHIDYPVVISFDETGHPKSMIVKKEKHIATKADVQMMRMPHGIDLQEGDEF